MTGGATSKPAKIEAHEGLRIGRSVRTEYKNARCEMRETFGLVIDDDRVQVSWMQCRRINRRRYHHTIAPGGQPRLSTAPERPNRLSPDSCGGHHKPPN